MRADQNNFPTPARQRGVALVITLILLSIITFLAVAFLLVARRERGQVTLASNQADAELAAATAVERAKGEILARILGDSNLLSYDLLVSTNQDVFPANGTAADLTILQYDPRAPAMMDEEPPLGRFYLDLTRNGMWESNLPGWGGEPEWVAVTDKIGLRHAGDNRFRYRYAYLVQAAGKTLDWNYIHNQAKRIGTNVDGFLRNQGVGSWELNLAAFLDDLNTNAWTNLLAYAYDPINLANPSAGTAFEDARDLLRYRYRGSYANLKSAIAFFDNLGGSAATAFRGDGFDTYSDGPLWDAAALANRNYTTNDNDDSNLPWPGSDSPNRFFHFNDLFDTNKLSPVFVSRLRGVLNNTNSDYDRYTLTRLLAQLGTDTAPQTDTNKIHLNYINFLSLTNATNFALLTNGVHYTNFVSWRSSPETMVQFFTNVAERLYREQSNEFFLLGYQFTNINHIPIDQYAPPIHRLLQVAANLFDANWNDNVAYAPPPTIFRPVFGVDTNLNKVIIKGYKAETGAGFLPGLLANVHTRDETNLLSVVSNREDVLIYGIPLIIGSRKGYPNFNELTVQSYIQVERRLEFVRTNSAPNEYDTNQMYILGISNVFGLEAWNSYSRPFPRALELFVAYAAHITITNENGVLLASIPRSTNYNATNYPPFRLNASNWLGGRFNLTPRGPMTVLSNMVYFNLPPRFESYHPNPGYDPDPGYSVPRWFMTISNRVIYYMVDQDLGRVVDFVCVDGLAATVDIFHDLVVRPGAQVASDTGVDDTVWWRTNAPGPGLPPVGVANQIRASLGDPGVPANWNDYGANPSGENRKTGIDKFRARLGLRALYFPTNAYSTNDYVFQAPFTPLRRLYRFTTWQVNDPQVHYLSADYQRSNYVQAIASSLLALVPTNCNLGKTNEYYRPWGGNPSDASLAANDPGAYNRVLKDPMVRGSDDWDFPADEFPSIGWVGRVHRGTPWQTVYLKAVEQEYSPQKLTNDLADWYFADWYQSVSNQLRLAEAGLMHPINDWRLLDLFITAPHPNATRGLLSINQTNLAAWSAALSGVLVLSNATPDPQLRLWREPRLDDLTIEPNSPQLFQLFAPTGIVVAINNFRDTRVKGMFTNISELMAVPELTINSPFLNKSSPQLALGLTDAVYERIPQQIFSLLKVGEPRFVIYAWGQALRPAPKSVVFGPGPQFQLCTNYQIAGEVATRTVVRVENVSTNGTLEPRIITESFNILPPD